MVQMVIKHVLGVGTEHSGLYGDTSAYYGTVEQQGRLTLHMHMMLWINRNVHIRVSFFLAVWMKSDKEHYFQSHLAHKESTVLLLKISSTQIIKIQHKLCLHRHCLYVIKFMVMKLFLSLVQIAIL